MDVSLCFSLLNGVFACLCVCLDFFMARFLYLFACGLLVCVCLSVHFNNDFFICLLVWVFDCLFESLFVGVCLCGCVCLLVWLTVSFFVCSFVCVHTALLHSLFVCLFVWFCV